MYASLYTLEDIKKYKKITKIEKKEKDERKTKKSKDYQKNINKNDFYILGPRSLKLQELRGKSCFGKNSEKEKTYDFSSGLAFRSFYNNNNGN